MTTTLLKSLSFVLLLAACSSSRHSSQGATNVPVTSFVAPVAAVAPPPAITADARPQSLMDLPQPETGGFVLQPGFYEAEFKTYCLQPGTPDPRQGDAYLQGPVTGHRKEMVEDVLLASREHPGIDQKNVQLLLWSMVSGSNFNSLSYAVQRDAAQLLTPKQVFELRGGWVGALRQVSQATGLLKANNDITRLFESGIASYEAYERIAVRTEPARIIRPGVVSDQWYRQEEGYYTRYFPESYKKIRIQVYVPDSLFDSNHQVDNEYVVFDPTGQGAVPAYTNAQRLGIGAPVLVDIVRKVIKVTKKPQPPRVPEKKDPKTDPGKAEETKM
jgi:hypothetical protein